MKTKEIAEKYDFDLKKFEAFLSEVGAPLKTGKLMPFNTLPDEEVDHYVTAYQEKLQKIAEETANKKAEAERIRKEKETAKQNKLNALSEMLVTSESGFEGYTIVKYSGMINASSYLELSRQPKSSLGAILCANLGDVQDHALLKLKNAAYELGCNAIIGINFNYISMEPERNCLSGCINYDPYVVCVAATGNAVVIEKK